MTAGHDGTPENDDPFGYLYRSEGAEQQPEPDVLPPRTPRTSYNSVQRVGERRPPQQPQQGGYGYPQQGQQPGGNGYGYPQQGQPQQTQQQQQYGYDQTQQQYGAPTQQYGAPQQPSYEPPSGGHRGNQNGSDAPSRKGLLIGAVAVVAAVAIGIAFAMTNSSGSKKQADGKQTTAPAASSGTAPSTQPSTSASAPAPFTSQKVDASTLALAGGAQQSTQWPGSAASTYVDHMNAVGASAAWTVTVPKDGPYTLFLSYGNAGQTANLTLGINGKPRATAVNLPNYGNYTTWDKAWGNHTYQWVDLKQGANVLSLTCMPNANCGVNLDQVWLKEGKVKQ